MSDKQGYEVREIAHIIGVDGETVFEFIRKEWLVPADPIESTFDEEDIARARFIHELQENFGVNDEAVSIILHLVDQLHYFQNQFKLKSISNGFSG